MGTLQLHFTLGPVQKFVARSRRTRDLWGSSYLLSYLAGKAMLGALHAADVSHVSLPAVSTQQIEKLLKKEHATLPNRFALGVRSVDIGRAAGSAASEALRSAWRAVAGGVWERYLDGVGDSTTREIWDRQVESFWEVAWIVSDAPGALASRKTWRTPPSAAEGGDHCTMMGDLQELSGFVRHRERDEQVEFWSRIRGVKGISDLDLAEDERLSAVAFIKRFFPKIANELVGVKMNVQNWPSTAYVAAAPWVAHTMRRNPEAARDFGDLVFDLADESLGERNTRLASLESFGNHRFVQLDGNFYFDDALANKRRTPIRGEAERPEARESLRDALRTLQRTVGESAAPYYAMLLMDGDSMGELMGAAAEVGKVVDASSALVDFATDVPDVVKGHDGVTIYAGGDDVLALLPVPKAIPCAAELATAYESKFRERLGEGELAKRASLSGGIVFAHYRAAFSSIMRYAHSLLDDVAKDATGRKSLAVALYKASGLALQWSAPWDHIRREPGTIFEEVFDKGQFSQSFFYNIRTRIGLLTDQPNPSPGTHGRLFEGFAPESVLVADYLASGDREEKVSRDEARKRIDGLMQLCRRYHREDGEVRVEEGLFGVDGAMLARFLASEGRELS